VVSHAAALAGLLVGGMVLTGCRTALPNKSHMQNGAKVAGIGLTSAGPSRLTVAGSVAAAERRSPGPYNFCPPHPGRVRATYSLDLPAAPLAGGWCQTRIVRSAVGYMVTLAAHWDARRLLRRSGSMTLVFRVTADATKPEAVDAVLIKQSGTPPP